MWSSRLKAMWLGGLLALLAACTSGRDFDRPDEQKLRLGATSRAELVELLGPARHARVLTMNDAPMDWFAYSYGTSDGARAIGFYMYRDVLVGHEFVSSLQSDSTNFNDSLTSRIQKGRSTRQDVIALLGPPSGEYVHPMVQAKDGRALVYLYRQVRIQQSMLTAYEKKLVVTLDPAGTVTDVAFTTDGRAY